MNQKLKTFFLKLRKVFFPCPSARRNLWLGGIFLFLLILGLLSPFSPVWAGLEWLPRAIGNVLVALFLQFFIAVSGVFVTLACFLLSWVTSPSFVAVSFTGTDNTFVTHAWGLVRDLANMCFVISLLVIGLGTALRIQEYKAQKTLPLLIIFILLVNFTPVICGVVIDASHIIMNFFLGGGISLDWLKNIFSVQTTSLWSGITTTDFWEKLGQSIGMLGYNIFAGLIFLLFSFLFAARYVALWALVILSPLAFFSYVLPATRKIWDMWLNQFLQWTFVGVIGSFWLYLGEQIVMTQLTSPSPPSDEFGGLSAIFAYTIPIIFFGAGLLTSLSFSAIGAKQAIGAAKKAGGLVATGAKFAAKSALESKAGKQVQKGLGEAAGSLGRQFAKEGAFGKIPLVSKGVHSALSRYAVRARRFELPKDFSERTPDEQADYIETQIPYGGDRLKGIFQMIKDDTLKYAPGIQKEAAKLQIEYASDLRYKKEVGAIMDVLPREITAKARVDFEITDDDKKEVKEKIQKMTAEISAKAEITPEIKEDILEEARRRFKLEKDATVTDEQKEETIRNIAAGAVHAQGLKPRDIEPMIKSSLTSLATRFGSQKWTQSHFQRLLTAWDPETVEKVFSEPGGLNTIIESPDDLDRFAMEPEGYRLIRFFAVSPIGRTWGWSGLNYITDEEDKPTTRFEDFEKRFRKIIEPGIREERGKKKSEEKEKKKREEEEVPPPTDEELKRKRAKTRKIRKKAERELGKEE